MGLPYNPSSFASNKTILQAIEELKEYLKNNPCYKVYYVNTPYVVGTYTYNLSDVDDPDDTMTPYDVVIFNNSYYAKVIVVDTNTFDIDPAVDFRGATGPAGADGTDGTDGVSITGVSIDASQHLIITLSDGNTIDAGALPTASFDIVEFNDTLSSGTFSASDLTLLKGDSTLLKGTYYGGHYYLEKYQYGYLYYESIHRSGNGTYSCECISIDASTGAWVKLNTTLRENPRGTDIDSQTASLGQVLTADGDGGAEWGTVSSGYVNTVSITATSGTFTDSDFAKLGYGDSTIVYTDAYSVSMVYKLKLETASILEFEAIDAASRTNLKLIDVNKTTKAYSMTAISMITSSTISSGTATSGKVLTANGSGGCSWETAGGGGTTLTLRSTEVPYTTSIANKVSFFNKLLTTCKGCIVPKLVSLAFDSTTVNVPLSDFSSSSSTNLSVRSIAHSIPNNAVYIVNLIWNASGIVSASSSIVKISLSNLTMTTISPPASLVPIPSSNTTFEYYNDNDITL